MAARMLAFRLLAPASGTGAVRTERNERTRASARGTAAWVTRAGGERDAMKTETDPAAVTVTSGGPDSLPTQGDAAVAGSCLNVFIRSWEGVKRTTALGCFRSPLVARRSFAGIDPIDYINQQLQDILRPRDNEDYLAEFLAIQNKHPKSIGFFGTRHLSITHQQLIEVLSYAMVLTGNHIYTSGATGTNAAVIRGALRAVGV